MRFIKRFLRNLGVLIVLSIALLVLFPDLMRQIYQFYILLFGPGLCVLLLVASALPRWKRRRR
jgi:hypothetical protein